MNLGEILFEHPFAADDGLLHTVDTTVTAGARATAPRRSRERSASWRAPRQAVAVQLPNGPEFVVAMFGVWVAGGVRAGEPARDREREVDEIVERDRRGRARADAELWRRVARATAVDTTPDAAFITWTSGTTGRPKADRAHLLGVHGAPRPHPRAAERSAAPIPTARPTPNLIPVSLALNAGIYNVLFGLRAGARRS